MTADFELTIVGTTFKFRKIFSEDHCRPYRLSVAGVEENLPASVSQDFIDGLVAGVKLIEALNERKHIGSPGDRLFEQA